jgi:hypothetical protein
MHGNNRLAILLADIERLRTELGSFVLSIENLIAFSARNSVTLAALRSNCGKPDDWTVEMTPMERQHLREQFRPVEAGIAKLLDGRL